MINTSDLIRFVTPYYANKDIAHDLSHIERMLKYADKLIEAGNYEVNMDIIICAGYFHGIIYLAEGPIIEWLKNHQIPDDIIDRIIGAAWESQKDETEASLEGKVLHDAHAIEGGKTYLIVKSLISGAARGQTLEQIINHIENSVIDKGMCYLPQAQKIYAEEQNFAKSFIIDLKKGIN